MMGKTRDMYIRLFRELKDAAGTMGLQLNPATIWSDFETGLIPAVRAEFPIAIHHGCLFHFTQAIYRQVQHLGLVADYQNDEVLRSQVRQLMAIGFIPANQVRAVFQLLQAEADVRLANLFEYFNRQWMTNTPLAMWNVYGLERRTNNDVEGWHRRFNGLVQKHHPNIFLVIERFQDEQAATEVMIQQIEGGQRVNRPNARYESINRAIDQARTAYDQRRIDVLQYLRRVSYQLAAYNR